MKKPKTAKTKTMSMSADSARMTHLNNRIAILDARLGVGIGATRERERIAKQLAQTK